MFIGESVSVEQAEEGLLPLRFVWREQKIEVREIFHSWSDWHFGEGSHSRSWRNRRHRNYFHVRTDVGTFELYVDRGVRGERHVWILARTLDALEGEGSPPSDGPVAR